MTPPDSGTTMLRAWAENDRSQVLDQLGSSFVTAPGPGIAFQMVDPRMTIDPAIPATLKGILLVLLNYPTTWEHRHLVKQIMRAAWVKIKTARKYLHELIEAGYVHPVVYADCDHKMVPRYKVTLLPLKPGPNEDPNPREPVRLYGLQTARAQRVGFSEHSKTKGYRCLRSKISYGEMLRESAADIAACTEANRIAGLAALKDQQQVSKNKHFLAPESRGKKGTTITGRNGCKNTLTQLRNPKSLPGEGTHSFFMDEELPSAAFDAVSVATPLFDAIPGVAAVPAAPQLFDPVSVLSAALPVAAVSAVSTVSQPFAAVSVIAAIHDAKPYGPVPAPPQLYGPVPAPPQLYGPVPAAPQVSEAVSAASQLFDAVSVIAAIYNPTPRVAHAPAPQLYGVAPATAAVSAPSQIFDAAPILAALFDATPGTAAVSAAPQFFDVPQVVAAAPAASEFLDNVPICAAQYDATPDTATVYAAPQFHGVVPAATIPAAPQLLDAVSAPPCGQGTPARGVEKKTASPKFERLNFSIFAGWSPERRSAPIGADLDNFLANFATAYPAAIEALHAVGRAGNSQWAETLLANPLIGMVQELLGLARWDYYLLHHWSRRLKRGTISIDDLILLWRSKREGYKHVAPALEIWNKRGYRDIQPPTHYPNGVPIWPVDPTWAQLMYRMRRDLTHDFISSLPHLHIPRKFDEYGYKCRSEKDIDSAVEERFANWLRNGTTAFFAAEDAAPYFLRLVKFQPLEWEMTMRSRRHKMPLEVQLAFDAITLPVTEVEIQELVDSTLAATAWIPGGLTQVFLDSLQTTGVMDVNLIAARCLWNDFIPEGEVNYANDVLFNTEHYCEMKSAYAF